VLNITFESARRVVTVRCQGRLVFGLESALFGAAVPLHRREIIIVDLSGVTAIDAAGIGALISLRAAGTYLRLVDPSETVRRVLRLTNLYSVFDISESECGKPAATPLELKVALSRPMRALLENEQVETLELAPYGVSVLLDK
jgi:anti-anti-sigma factor